MRLVPVAVATVLFALAGTAFAGPFGLPIPLPVPIPGANNTPAAPVVGEVYDAYATADGAVWCADKASLKAGTCSEVTYIKGEKVQAKGAADKDGILPAATLRGGYRDGFVRADQFGRSADLTEYKAWVDGLATAYPEDQRLVPPALNWLDILNKPGNYKGKKVIRSYGAIDRKELKYNSETNTSTWLDRIPTQADAPADKTAPILMRFKSPALVAAYKNGQIGYSCGGGGHCDSIKVVATPTGEVHENVGSGGVVMKWPIFEVEVLADRHRVWKAGE